VLSLREPGSWHVALPHEKHAHLKKDKIMSCDDIRKTDPVKRLVEDEIPSTEGSSPMDPPDAYAPPATIEEVPRDQMHAILREFYEEHDSITESVVKFEKALVTIQKEGITREANQAISSFFEFLDTEFVEHDKREEKVLFPPLSVQLIKHGEHSQGTEPTTAIDIMEDDHLKAIQLAGVTFNLFALAMRLPDERSRMIVLDKALEQGRALVELLRLHIFRENSIVFPLAHKYIEQTEFDQMKRKRGVVQKGIHG
jgi:hemerythrin-like domain-containing protein|tara:strand:+ start:291 stop:1055 length:765 start_codon:yes stop_codon:yes gene_type:complete